MLYASNPAVAPAERCSWTWQRLELCSSLTQCPSEWVVSFEFASDALDDEAERVLDGIAAVLRRHCGLQIFVEGHARPGAPALYAQPLSQARATRVRKALLERLDEDKEWTTYDPNPREGVRPRGGYSESIVEFEEVSEFYVPRIVGTKLQASGVWERGAAYVERLRLMARSDDGQCAQVTIRGMDNKD